MISSVVRTVLVYLAVVVAMRLMGKRQLGELQPEELWPSEKAIETALEILNSTLVWFCPKYAQLLLGKPVTIIRNGEILQDELAQLRITASDLAEALRGKDIFSPKDVYWGVIEPNGSITAAPMPQDGGEPPMLPLLIDKAVYKENLAFFGMDAAALDALLRREQTTREAVLLLLYNGKKSILIQKKAAPKGAA